MVVRLAGLEPATRCLEGSRSGPLSYKRWGIPSRIRTDVTALKGQHPGPLDDRDMGALGET